MRFKLQWLKSIMMLIFCVKVITHTKTWENPSKSVEDKIKKSLDHVVYVRVTYNDTSINGSYTMLNWAIIPRIWKIRKILFNLKAEILNCFYPCGLSVQVPYPSDPTITWYFNKNCFETGKKKLTSRMSKQRLVRSTPCSWQHSVSPV